jgi:hypothetical protein
MVDISTQSDRVPGLLRWLCAWEATSGEQTIPASRACRMLSRVKLPNGAPPASHGQRLAARHFDCAARGRPTDLWDVLLLTDFHIGSRRYSAADRGSDCCPGDAQACGKEAQAEEGGSSGPGHGGKAGWLIESAARINFPRLYWHRTPFQGK